MKRLFSRNIEHVVLSTGYMSEHVQDFVRKRFNDYHVTIVKEVEPLGTGGGLLQALQACRTDEVLVLNGDSYFNIDYDFFYHHHHHHQSVFSIALKPMNDFSRYDTVACDSNHRIVSFSEKKQTAHGLINGGVYIVNRTVFTAVSWPLKFSLEKDYMEKYHSMHDMFAFPYDEYFIDIGIPEDYAKAQYELKAVINAG